MSNATLGGPFTFPGTSLTVHRMGYGAMQLTGPGIWGPPRDPEAAVAILREAVAAGVNHIDTSDFYGPHVTNQIIRKALHPYPAGLVIVTKLGARRPPDRSWQRAISSQDLTAGVHDNLRNLGMDALDIVNYRTMGSGHGPAEGSIAEQVTVLADLRQKGLIRHIGVSNVTAAQIAEAAAITEIVCVQNNYNLAHGQEGYCVCAVFPAWRVYSAAVGNPLFGRRPARGQADAGRAGVAASSVAQYPSYPRHIVWRPPPGKLGRGRAHALTADVGGAGRDRCRGGCGEALTGAMPLACPPGAPFGTKRAKATMKVPARRAK